MSSLQESAEPSTDNGYAGPQALLVAVIEAAIRDAHAGDEQARRFLTDAHGLWAESRRDWLAHTSLRDEVFRRQCCKLLGVAYVKAEDRLPMRLPPAEPPRIVSAPPRCTYRTNVLPGSNLRQCNARTRVARVIDLLAQAPLTIDELTTGLVCTPVQARNAVQNVIAKGYGTSTARDGKISLRYPQGHDKPLSHRGT
jgi:hypothetical protein